MNMRTRMLWVALLVLPAVAWSGETAKPAAIGSKADETGSRADPPALKLGLHDASVQKVIRASAQRQASTASLAADTPDQSSITARGDEMKLRFRAPLRPDHITCDILDCVAYTADDVALYTIPREQYYGPHGDTPGDEWLSCQSHDDLLSTFERYDKCRGISIGIPPVAIGNVQLDLPKLRL
jgi:hypothetical protein